MLISYQPKPVQALAANFKEPDIFIKLIEDNSTHKVYIRVTGQGTYAAMTEITDSPQGKVEVTVGILYEGDYVVIDAGGNLGIWAKDRFEEVHDKLEPS